MNSQEILSSRIRYDKSSNEAHFFIGMKGNGKNETFVKGPVCFHISVYNTSKLAE